MEEIDSRLKELQLNIVRQGQLKAQRNSLYDQRRELKERERSLALKRDREQQDVETLEHQSLKTFFYHVTGAYGEKLDKEKREAYEAAVKHDAVLRELEAVQEDIRRIESECAGLHGCEAEYDRLLKEKKESIVASDPVNGPAILKLEQDIQYLEGQKREISEAISAARTASSTAASILSSLDSAESWGTWDLFGGGLITDLAKYGHIDDAQRKVEKLQVELRRLKTELSDVEVYRDMSVDVDSTLRFADYFFDCIFVDWAVLNRIRDSREQVENTKRQVERVISGLNRMLEETARRQEGCRSQVESLVVMG